jgi:cytochrome oxidase assembly protein ShyY1
VVSGVIGPDRTRTVRLIADDRPAGLQAARRPSLEDVPNNHLAYAVQWFFFAFVAAVIYFLALRRRTR